jgi:hypothetical protein
MRFMGFVQMEEGIGAPPPALIDGMDALIGESEDAIENARRVARLHTLHWPEAELTITLRQISDQPPQAAG